MTVYWYHRWVHNQVRARPKNLGGLCQAEGSELCGAIGLYCGVNICNIFSCLKEHIGIFMKL
jgi:hypothetical protein